MSHVIVEWFELWCCTNARSGTRATSDKEHEVWQWRNHSCRMIGCNINI